MSIRDYVSICRIDHWFKQVFVLPGVAVALYGSPARLEEAGPGELAIDVILALLATSVTASSNYAINEYLDGPFDREHPEKRHRPAARGAIGRRGGVALWLVLGALGIALGFAIHVGVGTMCVLLWVMGVLYNVPPFRLKEKPYVDVLSESLNNPIRFAIGWAATGVTAVPPISILVSYWMLGAFLMATKRLGELRHIGAAGRAAAYRKSFAYYTSERLLVSILFYTSLASFTGGVFIVRYRLELLFAVPVLAAFLAKYLQMGFLPDSPTQHPERLYRYGGFVSFMIVVAGVSMALLFIDVPWLHRAFQPTIPPQ